MTTAAYAGTDLSVDCPNIGSCVVAPAGTPLFNESAWYPGSTKTQKLTIHNTSTQNGYVGLEAIDYTETKNLGNIVQIEIREGSTSGPIVYGGVTMHQFRDDAYFTIGDAINAGQTIEYFVTAGMPVTAGNQYQAAELQFDLRIGLEVAPIIPTSGTILGTTTASPTVCHADPPASAPLLSIDSVGTNTVSLSWTAVTPVTHYALVFTRNDGAQYGSTNIGNVTSYVVTNLSGGANYTFEVFGVNDCAPGPRSSGANTGNVPGSFIATRPLGPSGEILGVTEPTNSSPSPSPSSGAVAGESISACVDWKQYVPWILLIAQAVLLLLFEYLWRGSRSWFKYIAIILATAASIVLFYLLRQCDCFASNSILALLCRWYWVVALLLTSLVRLGGYAFVEEVETT